MGFHDKGRYIEVRKACNKAIKSIAEYEDFRAEAQSRHINWEAEPSRVLTSLPADLDNLLRNIAYREGKSFCKAMDDFFNKHLKMDKLNKKYSQRPKTADWQSWRRAVHNDELTEEEQKIDSVVRKMFDGEYRRNRPTISVIGF